MLSILTLDHLPCLHQNSFFYCLFLLLLVAGLQVFAQGVVVLFAAARVRAPEGESAELVGQTEDQLDAGVAFARQWPPPSSPRRRRRRRRRRRSRIGRLDVQRGRSRPGAAMHLHDPGAVRPSPGAGSAIQRFAPNPSFLPFFKSFKQRK